MAGRGFGPHEIVDISSDSEDNATSAEVFEFFDAQSENQDAVEDNMPNEVNAHFPANYHIADDGIIDLTGIPDVDVPPSDLPMIGLEAIGNDDFDRDEQIITEAVGLQMVLDFLPGISIDHVLGLLREKTTEDTRTNAHCRDLITQLVEAGDYPKEDDERHKKKRKRSDEDDWKDFEEAERDPEIPTYESDALNLLKDEFITVPVRHITNLLKEHKTLFKAYVVLEEQVRNFDRISNQGFSKIGKPRTHRGTELILIERGSQLPKELAGAKKKIESDMVKRRKVEEAEEAEAQNLRNAQASGQMGECACCFDDVPLNRMISCNGDITHSYCLECPKRQIETQMGMSKCRPTCFCVDDCAGTFARKDLQQVLGDRTFDRLEHLQQQQELAAAGLDFLSECPFCDFKMECLPVEVDKEFRCQNKKCGKTSCRLCDKETHIPLTCKESEKDGQLTLRHIVEEAMSAALIRHCNRCKQPFVKDLGCNKMACSHCGNRQCYVCSKNIVDYEHFGAIDSGRCPLHEDVENRHSQEVQKAADEAMAKVRAENPGVSDADLMIQVSDQVKRAEDARKGRARAEANAFPYHMVENQLRRFPPAIVQQGRPPVPAPPPVHQYVPANPYPVAAAPGLFQPVPVVPQVPMPLYHDAMGPAHLQPHQPVPFGANFFAFNRFFGQGPAPPPQQPPQPQLLLGQEAHLPRFPDAEVPPGLFQVPGHVEHGQQQVLQMQQGHQQQLQQQQRQQAQLQLMDQRLQEYQRQVEHDRQEDQRRRDQRRQDQQQRREQRREQRRLERTQQEQQQQGQQRAGQPGAGQPQPRLQAPLPQVANIRRNANNIPQVVAELQEARMRLLALRLNRQQARAGQAREALQQEDDTDLYEEPVRAPRRAPRRAH